LHELRALREGGKKRILVSGRELINEPESSMALAASGGDNTFLLAAADLKVRQEIIGSLIVGRNLTPLFSDLQSRVGGRLGFERTQGSEERANRVRVFSQPSGNLWLELPYEEERHRAFIWLFGTMGFAAVVLMALSLTMSTFLANNLAAPLKKLKEGLVAFNESRFQYRVNIETKDEFGEFAGTFNQMMQGFRASRLDPLTGLYNRRHFEHLLSRLHELRKRLPGSQYCLSFCDVDHFKKINDTYGHLVGDQALRHLARLLSETLPITDIIARYGGEEFVVIHSDASLDEARKTAEEIVKKVRETPLEMDGTKLSFSVSIGVAHCSSGEKRKDVLEKADRVLYQAKELGRDRVVVVG
jgi:diguanylate cyclase (GGDEF)-like protein